MRRSPCYDYIFRGGFAKNKYPKVIKEKLTSIINEMSSSPEPFVKNPGKDFIRKRKLPFESVIQLLLSIGGNSIYKELLETHSYDSNTATASAFVQQRDKILPSALEYLFHEFTRSFTDTKMYRGYRLLAVDGYKLNIATDPDNTDTYFHSCADGKGYNLAISHVAKKLVRLIFTLETRGVMYNADNLRLYPFLCLIPNP